MASKEFVDALKKCVIAMNDSFKEQFEQLEKDLEVLDIIKQTNVDIKKLKYGLRFKKDDVYLHYKYDFIMTREEFDLLKEWLERND